MIAFAALAGAAPASAWTPDVEYAVNCQGCHLADGSGTPGRVPPLAGSVARFLQAPGGRAYLVRVPGVASAPLASADLAALLNWMLRRFDAAHLPRDFAPYTEQEVERLRRAPLLEVSGERRRLLESVDAEGAVR